MGRLPTDTGTPTATPAIARATSYTVNDRDPQPLYHVERGDGRDAEAPITSDYPRDEWFHSHDCEYLYIFERDKTWTVLSYDPSDL